MKSSLLSRERAEKIFERHKKALAKDGSHSPVVYVSLQEAGSNKPTIVPVVVVPPNDPLGKEIYYGALRAQLQKKGTLLEALFVYEGWGVISKTRPLTRPSQHPQRKEVLGMMGRNRDKSRVTMVQQFSLTNLVMVLYGKRYRLLSLMYHQRKKENIK